MVTEAQVLVIDDSPINLQVLTDALTAVGYTVAIATSGERALKQLKTQAPNLIILDIKMPGMDGFETCRCIKADPRLQHIPVIFITAWPDIEVTLKAFSLGGVDYISKPFREAELLARVKTHLELQLMQQRLELQVEERTQALESALSDLKKFQLKLIQNEKITALGNLVAGVSHELNNPLGFVAGNVEELEQDLRDIFYHLNLHQQKASDSEIAAHAQKIDLDYLLEDIPKMIASMREGCHRMIEISSSLRMFSRANRNRKLRVNPHDGIDSALMLLKYRLRPTPHRGEIQIVRNYGDIPEISGFPDQLNQAFTNILVNAIDMFDEIAEESPFELQASAPKIEIHTHSPNPQTVAVAIHDNGSGMLPETCAKIFDWSFTTKAPDKGTGLGLTIARQIVEESHGGRLTVTSKVGRGSEFCLCLPTNL